MDRSASSTTTTSAEQFSFPSIRTAIHFGSKMVERLPEFVRSVGGTRPLIVTDPGVLRAGVIDTVTAPLESAGIPYEVFSEVPQDSSVAVVEKALAMLRERRCDVVVAVGGGSSMDTGKCVAIRAVDSRKLEELAGLGIADQEPLPVIAVPTTAGTGSEVSYWAVTRDDRTNTKFSVGGEKVFPKIALCDPELTVALPAKITAWTGMDALTHAIESYTNRSHQPISEVLALRAVGLLSHHIVAATNEGGDRSARSAMLLGSMIAGLAMNPTRLGAVHALAMPLGSGDLRIPHGAANAIMLLHVTEFNLSAAPQKYAEVARAMGAVGAGDSTAGGRSTGGRSTGGRSIGGPGAAGSDSSELASAKAGLQRLHEIVGALGIPTRMGELGLTRKHVPEVCREAMKSGNIPVNPRAITQEELEEICYRAI